MRGVNSLSISQLCATDSPKPYPVPDQCMNVEFCYPVPPRSATENAETLTTLNMQNLHNYIPCSRAKGLNSKPYIPLFQTKRLKNCTLNHSTYIVPVYIGNIGSTSPRGCNFQIRFRNHWNIASFLEENIATKNI